MPNENKAKIVEQNEKMKVCPDNKHRWGDVVTRDGTMGCLHCDSRKKVSDRFSFQLGQAHRMNANYSFRDEY